MLRLLRKRSTLSDRIFDFFNYAILGVVLLLIIYPLLYVLGSSFSSPAAVQSGRVVLFPVEFTIMGYEIIFQHSAMWVSFFNSVVYVVSGTAIGLALTVMVAYPLSRADFKAGGLVMFLVGFVMLFPPGMIPLYLLVSDLGMMDTRWSIILPTAITPFHIIIARTFFKTNVPIELHEAAQLDGCDEFGFFFRIALPISKAVVAVIILYCAVGMWNRYFEPMLYLTNQSLYPFQLFLRRILILSSVTKDTFAGIELQASRAALSELVKNVLVIVSMIPMLILYPFIQRHLTKGMMIGAIKG